MSISSARATLILNLLALALAIILGAQIVYVLDAEFHRQSMPLYNIWSRNDFWPLLVPVAALFVVRRTWVSVIFLCVYFLFVLSSSDLSWRVYSGTKLNLTGKAFFLEFFVLSWMTIITVAVFLIHRTYRLVRWAVRKKPDDV